MGENSALSVNIVKRMAFKNPSKNQKTAYVRGILINGLVPKGGLGSLIPFSYFAEQLSNHWAFLLFAILTQPTESIAAPRLGTKWALKSSFES
jgi:hypothetical protein